MCYSGFGGILYPFVQIVCAKKRVKSLVEDKTTTIEAR